MINQNEIEEAANKHDDETNVHDGYHDFKSGANWAIEKLKAEIEAKAKLVECVKFYSNSHNYSGGYYGTVSNDAEDLARQTLKDIGEEV